MDAQQERLQSDTDGERSRSGRSLLSRFEHHLWRSLVSGFTVLVPVLITYLIVRFLLAYVDSIFRPLFRGTPWDYPGVGIVVTLVLLYIVGAFLSGRRSQRFQDAIVSRIPFVKGIYTVARQATETLSSPPEHHFSRVVLVEWPRPGVRAMGFVTGHLARDDGRDALVAVYIPTVPNPTSGMLAFFTEEDVVETAFSVQDAMKMVFSGGIVLPEPPGRPAALTTFGLEESGPR